MMQTSERTDHQTAGVVDDQAATSIVVGVDGSERNRAAVEWAVAEASATERPLTLLAVLDDPVVPMPVHLARTDDERAWQALNHIAAELTDKFPHVAIGKDVAIGDTVTCLLDRSADQSTLVVGRRGRGMFARALIGSQAIAVAGRSQVPVVVVPNAWRPELHVRDAVVVGIDHRVPHAESIRYAFSEAGRREVDLVAAHGRELPAPFDWEPRLAMTEYDAGVDKDSELALEATIAPFRLEFPDVAVHLMHRRGHPLTVLLDDAGPTQLLVVGRHAANRHPGFAFGSVARGVLHYAQVPVAVVPERSPQ